MTDLTAASVREALAAFASPRRAAELQWFFKTEPGGYGEGDRFLGLTVPQSRQVAKQFRDLPAAELFELANSPWHEHRICALHIMVLQFQRAKSAVTRDELAALFMTMLDANLVNNWDLIDTSAPYIGAWWLDRDDALEVFTELVRHDDLWHRRAGIMFTFAFIRAGRLEPTWVISKLLLGDAHDLIHKAVGWMLREAGKRDLDGLRAFLDEHVSRMPRTMLRYAIEKMPEPERKSWLARPRAQHPKPDSRK
jgi:3-methyladenine DNA glycosylase AlkD